MSGPAVPQPSAADTPSASGRFLLRLEPGLHAALREAARSAGTSLNDYCARKLATLGGDPTGPGARVVARAAKLFAGSLVGVVGYGSWARGEMTKSSDIDILVIVSDGTPLTRELYRRWDSQPMSFEGHPIEPHFVHLPDPGVLSGTWAEVAIDGIVLFERDLGVSRLLATIRRQLVDGDVERRSAHGQPYWIKANRIKAD